MKLGMYDVRESLYYNKYRYRIELGQQWKRTSNFDKMESVILSLQRNDTRLHSSKSGYTHILYTNAKHDLVKLKLTSDKNTVASFIIFLNDNFQGGRYGEFLFLLGKLMLTKHLKGDEVI